MIQHTLGITNQTGSALFDIAVLTYSGSQAFILPKAITQAVYFTIVNKDYEKHGWNADTTINDKQITFTEPLNQGDIITLFYRSVGEGSPPQDINIIADGNSYMAGYQTTSSATLLMGMEPFNAGSTLTNFAVSGQGTDTMLTDQASQIFPAMQPNKVNILLVQEGGNDLGTNLNVSNAVANMKTYCRNAKNYAQANGLTLYVLIYNLIPRNQTGNFPSIEAFNSAMVDYNTAIANDNSGDWDGIIDIEMEPLFANYTAGGYQGDLIHPNLSGQTSTAERTKYKILQVTGNQTVAPPIEGSGKTYALTPNRVYSGTWGTDNNVAYISGSVKYATTPGDYYIQPGVGNTIVIRAIKGPNSGSLEVIVDDISKGTFSANLPIEQYTGNYETIATITGLTSAKHQTKVVVAGGGSVISDEIEYKNIAI